MIEQKALSVRIDADLHSRVRRRAFDEHVAVEALLRGWLSAYADGTLDGDTAIPPATRPVATAATPKQKPARTRTCPHRVPAGSFCKRCDEEPA